MPKKSLREMSSLERRSNSLSAKTFWAILIFSTVMTIAAVSFGFYLYNDTLRRQYRTETQRLSQTAAILLDKEVIQKEAEIVAEIYDANRPSSEADSRDPEYQELFSSVREDPEFEKMRHMLDDIRQENEAVAAYVAMLDYETNRMVFIIDGDQKDSFCPPGSWDLMEESHMSVFRYGAADSRLDQLFNTPLMRSVINRMAQYGYRCTAGTPLFDIGDYQVMVFFDTDMNQAAKVSRQFLVQYLIVMGAVGLISTVLIVRVLQRKAIDPINELSNAAAGYIEAKRNHNEDGVHFGSLNIRTGDEIENLALIMKDMEEDIAAYEADLTRVTSEKERINSELNVARQIQEGILPHIFPPFPERKEFDIYASMHAAKMVGGDFYDFFMIDDDHLAMLIADVSGKGIPAALFMMASKILIQNIAKSEKSSPSIILADVNEQICENNIAEMFLTVWFGILDIPAGKLIAANAGHEYPAIRRADGPFEIFKDKHSFVIGGMSGTLYKEYEISLQPGDVVFQYTDGVTEAVNAQNELFGMDRLIEVLNREKAAGPDQILRNMSEAIDRFAGGTAQFDDITMLCFRYNGMKDQADSGLVWEGEAKLDRLHDFLSFVETNLESANCPMKAQMKILVAVEEVFVNIASYAYPDGEGTARVRMEFTEDPAGVRFTFADNGIAFDPFEREDPDITLSAEEREIGGLGIFMVKKTMDEVSYEYSGGQNILTILKRF